MSAAALTLSAFNSAHISQIISNNKRVDHLVDITNLHEKHFKAINQKLEYISDQLATLHQQSPFCQNDGLHGASPFQNV
jgi:hypothetical protein